MNFYFPNDSFSLENLLAGKINQKNFTDSEKYIVTYVQNWFSGFKHFHFQTSGSTGNPKSIQLSREQLAYSASSTLDFLYPNSKPSNLLLCINPKFIGGTQVITRAILADADLIYREPSSTPLKPTERVDLVSMAPLQVKTILNEDPRLFDKVGTVLIGGAELDQKIRQRLSTNSTRFFQTFGMTETASNVALRSMNEEFYQFIGDTKFSLDERECLALSGTVTNNEVIQTNDIVKLVSNGFTWKGRADWVINSGGIKLHPEVIEKKIHAAFPEIESYITKVKDEKFGEKVVLCSQKPILGLIKEGQLLDKYQEPKIEILLEQFPRTSSGKINRMELQSLAESNVRIIGKMP